MQATELQLLAAVADTVPATRVRAKTVSLVGDGSCLRVYHQGAYASALRTLEPFGTELAIEVAAAQFKQIAALFPDEDDVQVLVESNKLRLVGSSSEFKIDGTAKTPSYTPPNLPTESAGYNVVDTAALRAEIDLALEFAAEAGHHKQILTGVQLRFTPGSLNIITLDGVGMLFASRIPAREGSAGQCCVPALIAASLRLHTDEAVRVELLGRRLVTTSSHARFDCTTLAGELPSIARLTAPTERFGVDIPADALKTVVTAAKSFESVAVEIAAADGSVLLRTVEDTARVSIPGTAFGATPFIPDVLAKATKLGAEQHWEIAHVTAPALVTAEGRKLYCMPCHVTY